MLRVTHAAYQWTARNDTLFIYAAQNVYRAPLSQNIVITSNGVSSNS